MTVDIQALSAKAKSQVPQGILTPDKWIEEYNKKFAELIVQECVDIARSEGDDVSYLKNYFGVEE